MKPACNHQVKYEPKIVIHTQSDSFTDSLDFSDHMALYFADRRPEGAEQKSARYSNSK